jgi:hypothetical protein
MSDAHVIKTSYQEDLEAGVYNDAADQEIVMGWLVAAIKRGEFNGHASVIIDDEWFADNLHHFLRHAQPDLKRVENRSAYYSGGSLEQEKACLDAMCKNKALSGLEHLAGVFYETPAAKVRSRLKRHKHLRGLTVIVAGEPVQIGG